GEEQRQLDPDVGNNREQRVSQRVFQNHDALAQPLGPGRPDIILVDRVEHRGAHEARVPGDADDGDRCGGQNDVGQDVQDAGDRVLYEPGVVISRQEGGPRDADVDDAGDWEDGNEDGEDQQQHE